jgi:hypothetical protein
VAGRYGCRRSSLAARIPTGQDALPEDLRWGLEYDPDLRRLRKKLQQPGSPTAWQVSFLEHSLQVLPSSRARPFGSTISTSSLPCHRG